MSDDIYVRLEKIFESVFDEDDLKVTPELTADQVEDWDSLSHIQLLIAIEKEFAVKFRTSEVTNFRNVGELVKLLQVKLTA